MNKIDLAKKMYYFWYEYDYDDIREMAENNNCYDNSEEIDDTMMIDLFCDGLYTASGVKRHIELYEDVDESHHDADFNEILIELKKLDNQYKSPVYESSMLKDLTFRLNDRINKNTEYLKKELSQLTEELGCSIEDSMRDMMIELDYIWYVLKDMTVDDIFCKFHPHVGCKWECVKNAQTVEFIYDGIISLKVNPSRAEFTYSINELTVNDLERVRKLICIEGYYLSDNSPEFNNDALGFVYDDIESFIKELIQDRINNLIKEVATLGNKLNEINRLKSGR